MTLKPRLHVISEQDYPRIHEATVKILGETGVVFHSEEALAVFRKHGAKVMNKTVYLDRTRIEQALETCPRTFSWMARNEKHAVVVGEECLIQPNAGPVYIQDLDRGRRLALLEDYCNIQKLCQASDVVNLAGHIPVNPSDVNQQEKHLRIMHAMIKHADKPLIGHTVYRKQAQEMLDMMEIAIGKKGCLQDKHYLGVVVNPLSPLAYSEDALETMLVYAENKQPIVIAPAIMAGVSGPISLLGTVVQQNAEILAGIVLVQLINPGNPVVYSTASTTAFMKRASYCAGTPEAMLINIPNLQMGQDFYHLPVRTMCGITEAKTIDSQSGFETMQSVMMGMLGGAHILVQCLGVLDALMTTSYEKFIIDEEIIRRVKCVAGGIDNSDNALAVDVIQEIGPTGTYLTHQSTYEHFRERWAPTISNWEPYDNWAKAGGEEIVIAANRKLKEILHHAPPSLIDAALDQELMRYIHQLIEE
ncbi:trimethylamine methyltransferase family protein [Candidatus Formimonas warabiya]|uniref:Methyltransferase n=1 Tax=Formimonas warabiya TaxID=1761012 RepID=A0A3G1KY77_FORW1|nr:trimethylamine methyltransferase family protein [Candidatus Formimonas warabiya]ATW27444.1 trimethylamine--corrinoid methyltransferase [Candidatus Formimonas warabiya]